MTSVVYRSGTRCLRVGPVGPELRKPRRFEDVYRQAAWCRLMADEPQAGRCAAVREQASALAHHDRGDHEPQRVDQPGGQ